MNTQLMFSSANDCWATPQKFFDELNKEFQFDIDVCAVPETAKCYKYFTPEQDALIQEWHGMCFMNPPYGREIGKWVKKAYEETQNNSSSVVCLLPARTDTKWFHDYCTKGEIRFIKGRLVFGTDQYWEWLWEQEYINGKKNSLFGRIGKRNSAPFPSMVVIF